MGRKYYYGPDNQYYYHHQNFSDAVEEVIEIMREDAAEPSILIEVTVSKKSHMKVCLYEGEFYEISCPGYCGVNSCSEYEPRNGKNGICVYHSHGLIRTGRKWDVFRDGTVKKKSGRNKTCQP
jgi:hypothetical protein